MVSPLPYFNEKHACQGRRRHRPDILDKIFHCLRRGTHLRDSDIVHGCGHIGGGERHEDGSQAHQHEEGRTIFDRGTDSKEEKDRPEDHAQARDEDAAFVGALEQRIPQIPADKVTCRQDQDDWRHREEHRVIIVAALGHKVSKEKENDHVPGKVPRESLQKNTTHIVGFLKISLASAHEKWN